MTREAVNEKVASNPAANIVENLAVAHSGRRGVVAVDLDEVLCPFVEQLCKFYNKNAFKYSFAVPQRLGVKDFTSYRFCEVWGGNDLQSLDIVHEFFESAFFADMPVIQGAHEGVTELRNAGFDLVVVTSRQSFIENATKAWLDKYFPQMFTNVVFGNHWGLHGQKVSKSKLCRLVRADILIDDSVSYTMECANEGVKALLFGSYPWNSLGDVEQALPPSVERVSDWLGAAKRTKELLP